MSNYTRQIERLNERYNPEHSFDVEQRTFSATSGDYREVSKYVLRAMREVDSTYTITTKSAGEAVKNHLSSKLDNVKFEYQGSVMTNTHIRGYSDIDLLTICGNFYYSDIQEVRSALEQDSWKYNNDQLSNLRNYERSFSPYCGDACADLRKLRMDNEILLSRIYLDCDTTKSKAIKITNRHLNREVDVVTSAWYSSFQYVLNGCDKKYQGIVIYQKDTDFITTPDYPFLSIARINERSSYTQGRLKRMIRFLKNLRSDADKEIKLTSFDINAICYDIPVESYINLSYRDIVNLLYVRISNLLSTGSADNLMSVVGDEYVFRNNRDKLDALKLLEIELLKINCDLKK